jgi:hypothetical protein
MPPPPELHPTLLALVTALHPTPDDAAQSVEALLRRAQTALLLTLQNQESDLTPHQGVLLQAATQLLPRADDAQQPPQELLRRVQVGIDAELSKWTSAVVQPPGPSGTTAVPEPVPPASPEG